MCTIPLSIIERLHQGGVIPAHPLVLNDQRQIDEYRQRQLTRYYLSSGAIGIAVGVHTTQFEIRKPTINLFEKVLKLASEEIHQHPSSNSCILIAGLCGPTEQALREADLSREYGYHLGLLSNGGLSDWTELQLIKRAEQVGEHIPLFGFYLQAAVGGRYLSFDFWKDFADLPNVHAIKIAAFNRYQTLDVVRAVCHSSRASEIALYTGNDDNIVADLLTNYSFEVNGTSITKTMVGGLLGHWAVWTSKAVTLINEIKSSTYTAKLLNTGIEVTDMNAALFDVIHDYKGCIAGIHEILKRQGLMKNIHCLDPNEGLSPGQADELTRICHEHRHLTDDDFVQKFLNEQPVISGL